MRRTATADVMLAGHRDAVDGGRAVLAQCGLFRRLSDTRFRQLTLVLLICVSVGILLA